MADIDTVQDTATQAAEKMKEQAPTVARRASKKAAEVIEQQKPKVQSTMQAIEKYSPPVFIGLTLASIISSVMLFSRKSKDNAIFVGLWAPTFLSLGLFYTLIGAGKMRK